MSSIIVLRNRTYYLRRRVPARFAAVESRKTVWFSLKTDSKTVAEKKASLVWESLIVGWEAQLAGCSDDAVARFEAAREIAARHGFRYLPIRDLQNLPFEDILARVELLLSRNNDGLVPPILGTVEVPGLTVSEALKAYWELTPDQVRGKSPDQRRRWVNPRKKAIQNFIKVAGDVPVSQITRNVMLNFRTWWMERIVEENLTPNSANKDFIHLSNVLKTVNDLKGLGFDIPLHGLALKEDDKRERLPFSDDWIQNRLLAPNALSGLNDEARAIFLGMVNTGYRPSEAAGLTGERIRLDDEVPHIAIAPAADRQIKNRSSRREIPLTGISLAVFQNFPSGFPHYRSKPATLSATVNKWLCSRIVFLLIVP